MERKLVKHGSSTLMVSLPKKWSDSQGLDRGDTVHITTVPDKLIISKKETKKKMLEGTAYFEEASYDQIREKLGDLYRRGYQKLEVGYKDPKCFFLIELIVGAIQGFEIVEHEDRKCTIKNVTSELSLDTQEIIKKIASITNLEFLVIREYLVDGEKNKSSEIRAIRDDCWKFRNMLYVHLKETLMLSAFDDYLEAHLIEYNASFLYWLYRSFDKSNLKKVSKEFIELYDSIHKYFNESIKRMRNKDEDYVKFIKTTRDNLLKSCEDHSLKNSKDRFLIIYLSMIIQNIQNPKSLVA